VQHTHKCWQQYAVELHKGMLQMEVIDLNDMRESDFIHLGLKLSMWTALALLPSHTFLAL
jgi:hypothetical protein